MVIMAQVSVVAVCVCVCLTTHSMQESEAQCYRVASMGININARLGSAFLALVLLAH